MQDNKSQPLILAHSVRGQMSFCHGALSVVCPFTIAKIAIGTLINTKPEGSIALAIQEYDTIGPYLNSNPPKSGAIVNLSCSFFLFFSFLSIPEVFLGVCISPKCVV